MYADPKNRFRASGVIRKLANGHCTATKVPRNSRPAIGARNRGRQRVVLWSSRSTANAGTTTSNGNSHGMKWVTTRYTGPSFGAAGKSGRIHRNAMANAEYTDVTIVHAHRCREATATATRIAGVPITTAM